MSREPYFPRMNERARHIVTDLRLRPHPEGGHFGEVFRSSSSVTPHDDRTDRPALTAIYFLLCGGEHSAWHQIRSDEVWHHLEGDALELLVINAESMDLKRKVLGPVDAGQGPVQTVPARHWQAARTLGAYTLVGCTVGPGFVFEDFRLIGNDAAAASRLREAHPDLAQLL